MHTVLKIGLVIALAVTFISFSPDTTYAEKPECNWGEVTSEAIAAGFSQGQHSSDPSGDGHGPDDADQPRKGLANVVNQGDMETTCELIDSLLND